MLDLKLSIGSDLKIKLKQFKNFRLLARALVEVQIKIFLLTNTKNVM